MKNRIGIIPARGGSKGIRRKNISDISGQPLIAWTIRAALESDLDKVFVSSDCDEILEVSQSLGANIIKRPVEYSGDNAKAIDVVKHALSYLDEAKISCEAIAYLQPTSPLRKAEHVNEALKLYQEKEGGSVISVVKVPHNFIPESLMQKRGETLEHYMPGAKYQRQEKPEYFARNGPAIVIAKPESILEQSSLYAEPIYGYEMGFLDSIDIDAPEDLELFKAILAARKTAN